MTNGKMLKEKINDAGMKIGFIAQELGITVYGFYNKIKQ